MARSSFILVLLAIISLHACQRKPSTGKLVIRLGHIGIPGSPYDQGCHKFKELLEGRTDGRVEVRVFAAGQLGEDREMLEGLRLGTLEMHAPSSVLHSVEPMFGLFDLAFLIEDREQMACIAEGPLGKKLAEKLLDHDLVLPAYWENGFRMITNNVRPIIKPEDLRGIKLRTPKDPERVKLFDAFGANPTSMSFAEVFSALKQGVIDGQENPLSHIVTARIHEVQRFLSLSRHVYSPAYPLMSRRFYESLPEDIQRAITEAAVEVGRFHRVLGEEKDRAYLEMLEQQLEVSAIDHAAFEEVARPLYRDYSEHYGEQIIEEAIACRRPN